MQRVVFFSGIHGLFLQIWPDFGGCELDLYFTGSESCFGLQASFYFVEFALEVLVIDGCRGDLLYGFF
ncbi:unnamed protein product [Thlaspi arvense]|uniref:Uncharacterized protein n=1 Tax=Thlaspi arvense TaxID=13288 RepID=A0AAU9SF52_THLAR|nr:unnamed protein product [Thlaspi arvense]